MRNPNRIDGILQAIGEIWHKHPDFRLGQLIGNVLEGPALYYVEDAGLVNALKNTYNDERELVNFDNDAYILDLVKKHPEELGFVVQEKDYEAYLSTYASVNGEINQADVLLSEHEFDTLKAYFKSNA